MKGKIRDVDVFFYPPGGRNFFSDIALSFYMSVCYNAPHNSRKFNKNIRKY